MTDQLSENQSISSRRNFVKNGALGGAAVGLSSLGFPMLSAAEKSPKEKYKVGVVGLGGRGAGAVADILNADSDTILWAVGDITADRMKKIEGITKKYSGRVDTDGGKREFVGFDSYQKVIDSGADIILLTTTPAFRPLHFEAAVAAGKHVFIEKPFALDIPGLHSVVETAKKAKAAGQSVLTGLVWRYTPHLMDMDKRLKDGVIGDILNVSSSYCGGGRPNQMPDPKFKPADMSDMEWALRFWQNFLELSGDGVLEYHIHGIDRMAWWMGDKLPARCYANGANIAPVKGANNWDSCNFSYEYEDGRTSSFFGRQIRGTYSASGDNIVGTKGRAVAQGSSAFIEVDGKKIWEGKSGLGYKQEHEIFMKHIREGKVYNDVIDQSANSHAVALMGRSAAYSGQLLTGEQIMASKDILLKDVEKLTYDSPFTPRESAVPGKTKFL
ncbi:Gfo/Idh/MocA family oxidoreductase [Akkermansiaceae bacterium]|nr:Gfo/Idh/MocA family oxidoreductase [Akkermansiaceae bacterium]